MRPRTLSAFLLLIAIGATSTRPLRGQTTGATRVIDIIATDANGAPLMQLRADDLMLRIDGRVHPLTAVGIYLPIPVESALPAPYASNQMDASSDISVAVDVTRFES